REVPLKRKCERVKHVIEDRTENCPHASRQEPSGGIAPSLEAQSECQTADGPNGRVHGRVTEQREPGVGRPSRLVIEEWNDHEGNGHPDRGSEHHAGRTTQRRPRGRESAQTSGPSEYDAKNPSQDTHRKCRVL